MFRFVACVLILMLFVAAASSKPDRRAPDPPPVPPTAVPDISGLSKYGVVSQRGRQVMIRGGLSWEATGYVREDGKVLLAWWQCGRPVAIGLYEVRGGDLVGHWNFAAYVTVDDHGNYQGLTRSEQIFKVQDFNLGGS